MSGSCKIQAGICPAGNCPSENMSARANVRSPILWTTAGRFWLWLYSTLGRDHVRRYGVVEIYTAVPSTIDDRPKGQTPLHGHRLRICCTISPTDALTTIVQQICHIAMPEPHISTCQDVGMWQIFVRWWWICCTTSCRIVASSSVGGVRSRCSEPVSA